MSYKGWTFKEDYKEYLISQIRYKADILDPTKAGLKPVQKSYQDQLREDIGDHTRDLLEAVADNREHTDENSVKGWEGFDVSEDFVNALFAVLKPKGERG